MTSLNEGRGRDPGDTPRPGRHVTQGPAAQRRPGSRPRRHPGGDPAIVVAECVRSTKAGVETPATLRETMTRPGFGLARSTKAGVETPATPYLALRAMSYSSSAQRRPGSRPRRHYYYSTTGGVRRISRTLNEGRGRDPGDTRRHAPSNQWREHLAQRRPGSRPRRHGNLEIRG